MNFEVTTSIFINVDYIIESNELNSETSKIEIMAAIDDYIAGMDDCDYYLVDNSIRQGVFDEILKRLGKQLTLFKN